MIWKPLSACDDLKPLLKEYSADLQKLLNSAGPEAILHSSNTTNLAELIRVADTPEEAGHF